jgi:hypothetical protein
MRKMEIKRFGQLLEKATELGLIEWNPTSDEVEDDGEMYRGYETMFGDWTVKTIVRQMSKSGGWLKKHERNKIVRGLEIEGKKGSLFFTSDPELLRGEYADSLDLFILSLTIQHLVEEKDPVSTLSQQLARMIHVVDR